MQVPKISVIMTVYNTPEEWLREAIASILNQTYSDFEFIIINDGSTNNAEDVILSYTDERIKYIKQDNQGIANAANRGLSIARGEYIARMDSDDISDKFRFEKQISYLDKHSEISVLGTNYERFPKVKIVKMPKNPKYLDFVRCCSIANPTVMFRRLDFEKYNLRYNPEYKCEDYELWSRAIKFLKFANLDDVLLKYRWHGNNTSKPSDEFALIVKKVQDNMLNFLTDNEKIKRAVLNSIETYSSNNTTYTFWERLFSIKNSRDRLHKVVTLFGIHFKFRR